MGDKDDDAPRAGSITTTNYTYTGQLRDVGTGLLYYNARFVSTDSVVPVWIGLSVA